MTARITIKCDGPCGSDVTTAARRLDVSVFICGGVLLPNVIAKHFHYCDRCFGEVARVLGVAVERWNDAAPSSSAASVEPSKGRT